MNKRRFLLQLFFVISLLMIMASYTQRPEKIDTQTEANFDWLLGDWIRSNGNENHQTYEYWSKFSDMEYRGLGCTLQNADTIFKEDMRLIKSDSSWVFMVYGVNEQATPFQITLQTDSSFVCENDKNEFPKKIKYIHIDEKIEAEISGGDQKIRFLFKKKSIN